MTKLTPCFNVVYYACIIQPKSGNWQTQEN